MSPEKNNWYTTLLVGLVAMLCACAARSEDRYVAVGRLSLDEPEDDYRAREDFYTKYCAPSDDKIAVSYYDQWRYHEMEIPYLGASWDYQVGSSRVDLQACKLEYSIVSPK